MFFLVSTKTYRKGKNHNREKINKASSKFKHFAFQEENEKEATDLEEKLWKALAC